MSRNGASANGMARRASDNSPSSPIGRGRPCRRAARDRPENSAACRRALLPASGAHGRGPPERSKANRLRPFRASRTNRGLVFAEIATDRVGDILRLLRLGREISGGFLGLDLDVSVGGDERVRDGNALDDVDALAHQRVIFHVAHRDETVDALDAEPMHGVRHQLLEAGVLNAGNAFGALEIGRRRVAALLPLARVIDQEFRDLAQRPAFLAVIDDDAETAGLATAGTFLDAVNQIRPAGADVGAEYVGAVALVVDPAGDLRTRVIEFSDVAEQINRGAADRRQED